jgi:hypothetical protein
MLQKVVGAYYHRFHSEHKRELYDEELEDVLYTKTQYNRLNTSPL